MLYVDRPRIQRDNPWLVVHELPEGVGDMLDAIRACLGGLDDDSLVDRQKSHYVRLIQHDEVAGHDRVLQATFDVGRFGEIGGNRRVDDHHPTHDYGPDEASVVALRVLFVVPKEARMALMFCERSYPYSAGTSLRRALIDYWDEQGWGERLSLRMSSVVYPDAWLEAAQVEAFEATSHGHQSDIEGISNGQGQPIGTLKLTVVPETQGIAQRIMR